MMAKAYSCLGSSTYNVHKYKHTFHVHTTQGRLTFHTCIADRPRLPAIQPFGRRHRLEVVSRRTLHQMAMFTILTLDLRQRQKREYRIYLNQFVVNFSSDSFYLRVRFRHRNSSSTRELFSKRYVPRVVKFGQM